MFEKVIARLASSLKKHRIPYMVVGGQAVLLHGSPRLTGDIDITLGVDAGGLLLVAKAAEDAGLETIPKDAEGFVKTTYVLPTRDKETGIRVDFIFSYTTYERQAIEKAGTISMAGVKVRFATAEDVVIHKIFSGRPRDLEDARSVLLKNPGCDSKYIKKWLREFDKTSEGKDFNRLFDDILRGLKRTRTRGPQG